MPDLRPHVLVFAVLLLTLALAAEATAQVRLVAHTDVPVFYGAGIDAEVPGRLRLASSMGLLPGQYVGLSNAVATPIFKHEGYSPEVAELVRATISRSTVWRTTIGWRPLKRRGFVFGAGYTLAGLGGNATDAKLLAAASGIAVPSADASQARFGVSATLQLVHAEAGWTFDLPRSLWLRLGVGMSVLFSANTIVDAEIGAAHPDGREALRQFETSVEDYLQTTFKSYVHPPHVSIAFGWWI